MLAAQYTRGGRGRPATLDMTNIIGGRRKVWSEAVEFLRSKRR